AALIAVRHRHRAVEFHGVGPAPGLVQRARHHDPEPEVVGLGAEALLQLLELGHGATIVDSDGSCPGYDGVSETWALNVIAGALAGSVHLLATVRMQASNASPSDGAKFEPLNWPDVKLADTDSVTVRACRPASFLSACS